MAVTSPGSLAAKPRARSFGREHSPRLSVSRAPLAENKMHAFIRRFLMHYGIYPRYPLGRFPALRNAWRAAQPCANYPAGLFGAWWLR
jgi:hypothetical protein